MRRLPLVLCGILFLGCSDDTSPMDAGEMPDVPRADGGAQDAVQRDAGGDDAADDGGASDVGDDGGGDAEPQSSCNDGIQNGGETAIDCGGECEPCATPGAGEMFISRDRLMGLPMSGDAWERMVSTVDEEWDDVDLSNMDSKTGPLVFGAALIYARGGDESYRTRVEEALARLPDSPLGRVLALARGLPAYVLAADLVGYREAAFVTFLDEIRTRDLGRESHGRWHVLEFTAEDAASNWGTWAAAARVTIDIFLDDTADLDRAEAIFRRYLGDESVAHVFNPTASFDASWVCGDVDDPPGINSAECGESRDGAMVEDISRGPEHPDAADAGITYSQNALRSILLQAILFERAGRGSYWAFQDEAMRRAGDFIDRAGGWDPPPFSTAALPATILNFHYGTDFFVRAPGSRSVLGHSLGFVDWLFP